MRKWLLLMMIGIGITLLLHQHAKAEVMYLTYEQQEEKEIHRVQPNERTKNGWQQWTGKYTIRA